MNYVMGDIHGHFQRFVSILLQIQLKADDTLFILGDVIDRNPDGLILLSFIMETPNIKMILGNHEYMMLQTLTADNPILYDAYLDQWYSNGGKVTHDAEGLGHRRRVRLRRLGVELARQVEAEHAAGAAALSPSQRGNSTR